MRFVLVPHLSPPKKKETKTRQIAEHGPPSLVFPVSIIASFNKLLQMCLPCCPTFLFWGEFGEYLPSLPFLVGVLGFDPSPLPCWGWRGRTEHHQDGFGGLILFFLGCNLSYFHLGSVGASPPGAELVFGVSSSILSPRMMFFWGVQTQGGAGKRRDGFQQLYWNDGWWIQGILQGLLVAWGERKSRKSWKDKEKGGENRNGASSLAAGEGSWIFLRAGADPLVVESDLGVWGTSGDIPWPGWAAPKGPRVRQQGRGRRLGPADAAGRV